MKNLLFSMMCLIALSMQAQRCAVLDFQVGTGVTEEDIEGISFEFRSKFNPSGYKMLERSQVKRTIQKFGYKATDMTSQQVLKVGRNLDASIIVVGTMNKLMDEYSVEIRVIDVSSGRTIASEGSNFERKVYRSSMQNVAQSLSIKLSSGQGSTTTSTSSSSANTASVYVDLGLPSGTKWKDKNEIGFFTYDQAMSKYGSRIPEKWQWQELISNCEWTWMDGGYKVVGKNGNFIFLPAKGMINADADGNLESSNCGYYWSSTIQSNWKNKYGYNIVWRLGFSWNEIDMDTFVDYYGRSVRLINH